jgi:hypothetical protein
MNINVATMTGLLLLSPISARAENLETIDAGKHAVIDLDEVNHYGPSPRDGAGVVLHTDGAARLLSFDCKGNYVEGRVSPASIQRRIPHNSVLQKVEARVCR